ncbi:MAG: PKD domain-containing protein [Planctomycetes bacterium]|nr:PKD domain-containing protein [Planctomycetota bacterium]
MILTRTKQTLGTAVGIAIILLITGAFAGNVWAADVDLQIEDAAFPGPVGDGQTYPTEQSVTGSGDYNGVVTYNIVIQNDGITGDYQYSVSSSAASGSGWWITYYEAGTGDITSNINNPSGWLTPSIAQGSSITVTVGVTHDITVLGGEEKDIIFWAMVTTDTNICDWVIATTTANTVVKPDAQIKNSGDPSYTGDGTYNTTGTSQTTTQGVDNNDIVTYYFKVESDSNGDYAYSVTGTTGDGSDGWWITYYNAPTGTDITAEITGIGLYEIITRAGGYMEIRAEVTPDSTLMGGQEKVITIWTTASTSTNFSDVVVCTTTVNALSTVDNQIEKKSAPGYVGDDDYTTDGSQSVAQSVDNNEIVTYHIKIENDGNGDYGYSVTGTASSAGWWVTYYDAKTNGNPITADIIAGGWYNLIAKGQALEIRAEVEPITTVAGGDLKAISVWSCASTATNICDMVVATTTVNNMYKVDGEIGDPAYAGDNLYNLDGTGQTKAQAVERNEIVTYLLKMENDGNTADGFTITGPASGAGWWITYYDATTGGNDITASVIGLGWNFGPVARDNSKEVRVEVTPDLTVAGGTSLDTLMWLTSLGDTSKKDVLKATTTVNETNKTDLQIKNDGDPSYIGDDIYNLDGTGQTKAQALDNMATVTYYVKIQNDGNVSDAFTLTGTASGSGWYITYYDSPTYTNLTNAFVGTGWSTGSLAMTASKEIIVEITPDLTLAGATMLNSFVWATSFDNATKMDVVKATTTVNNVYKPDSQIKTSIGATYTGDGVYNLTGASQTEAQNVNNNAVVTYFIKVQNDGNLSDTFAITGTASGGGWFITYYDDVAGGNNITVNVVGAGWATASLAMNASKEIRVEVTPDGTVAGGGSNTLEICATSETGLTQKDLVKATTTVNAAYSVDSQVKNSTDGAYIGNGIYNLDGTNQTKSQNVNNTQIVTYLITIENDGNFNDVFTLTGTAGGSGWFVTYYDDAAAGTDITANVTGAGWATASLASAATKIIRVEVTPDATITNGTVKTLIMVATSSGDTSKKDTVGAATTAISGATVILSAGTYNPAASSEVTTTTNLTMLQLKISVTTGTENATISAVKVTPSGTANDNTDIAAVRLVLDANDNGISDTGDTILVSSTFATDNTAITMTLGSPRTIAIAGSENWLVVYNLNGSASTGETFSSQVSANADVTILGALSTRAITPSGAPVAGGAKTIVEPAANVTTGTSPLSVDFTAQLGTGSAIVQFEWDFNYDGTTFRPDFVSNISGDTTFTYDTAGTYTARLKITYADGSTITKDITITVAAAAGVPTISGLSAYSPTDTAPVTVTFVATATASAGQIEAYLWDYNTDGVNDYVSAVSAITNTAIYIYPKAGTYVATVMVQDSAGLVTKSSVTITAQAPLSTAPTANITIPAATQNIKVGEGVSFGGTGAVAESGTISKYEWDFEGDGVFDFGSPVVTTTSFTYLTAGSYTATFRVTEDVSGLVGEDTVTINVTASPTPKVAIIQPGVPGSNKDGLRRTVKGNITVKVTSVPTSLTTTLHLKYRDLGAIVLPDTGLPALTAPNNAEWVTTALAITSFATADAGAEGFITKLDATQLTAAHWYEIVALANYDGVVTYDDWNASQTNKRVFIYIEATTPETEETTNYQTNPISSSLTAKLNRNKLVTLTIPYGGVLTDVIVTVGVPAAAPSAGGLTFLSTYHEITLSGGYTLLKPAQIIYYYADTNNDGTVDGTTIEEETLKLYRYDATDAKWELLLSQVVVPDANIIVADTPGFSVFGAAGTAASGSSAPGLGLDWLDEDDSDNDLRCFIATAAYGTPMSKELVTLRSFRDNYLKTNSLGRAFVNAYYFYSPSVASVIAGNSTLKGVTRVFLSPFIWFAGFMLQSSLIEKLIVLLMLIGLFEVLFKSLRKRAWKKVLALRSKI